MEISTSDIEELPAETSKIGGADVEIDLDDTTDLSERLTMMPWDLSMTNPRTMQ